MPTLVSAVKRSERIVRGQVPVGAHRDYLLRTGLEAGGEIRALFDPVPAGHQWLLERLILSTTSSTATAARVFAGTPAARNLVDGTPAGDLAIAEWTVPVLVPEGVPLLIVWTGASTGAEGTARLQLEIAELVNVEV